MAAGCQEELLPDLTPATQPDMEPGGGGGGGTNHQPKGATTTQRGGGGGALTEEEVAATTQFLDNVNKWRAARKLSSVRSFLFISC